MLVEEYCEKSYFYLQQKRRKRLNVFYIIFEQERAEKVWMKWIAITAPDIFYGSRGLTPEKKFAVVPEALKVLKIIWNM